VDEIKRGSLTNRDGKDDKSFNASAYEGATEATKKLGIILRYVEASDDNAFEPLLQAFAQKDFDRIIDIGFVQEEPRVSGWPKRLVGTDRDDRMLLQPIQPAQESVQRIGHEL